MPTFDLRQFAPPATIDVTLASGQTVVFPGDPDTDDVGRMLRLEDEIHDATGGDLAEKLDEAKALLQRMARQADPTQDVTALRITAGELVVVMALLVHGETVAEAVARQLAPPAADDALRGDREGDPGPLGTLPPTETPEQPDSSLSESSSSGRSSGSDVVAASALATG